MEGVVGWLKRVRKLESGEHLGTHDGHQGDGAEQSRRLVEFTQGNGGLLLQVVHPHASSAGASPADEGSVTPGKKKRRASDHGRSSESQGTAPARPGRRWARGSGRSRRGRHSPRGDRPPPLRKALVTTLRALSEAIYQDVAQVCELQKHSPLTWEEQFGLGQLWGPLYSALQTVYTMANQAAYAFPAESWLLPGPPQDPGPQVPAADGREALGSPGERRGPTPPWGQS